MTCWPASIFLGVPVAALLISPLFRNAFSAANSIFVLHHAGRPAGGTDVALPPLLRKLIDRAGEAGLRFGSLHEALADKTVAALTFDDGYENIASLWPLLREKKIPLTIFVPTAYLGKRNKWDHPLARRRSHLTAAQIEELADQGVCFGSHSHTHVDFTALDRAGLEMELSESRRILTELTGTPPRYLAYPFGKFNSLTCEVARKMGFTHGFSSHPASAGSLARGRVPIGWLDNSLTLHAKLRGGALAGAEFLKCLVVSSFSHLTPLWQRIKQ
jgi:peptidoglycan/xylan/chitin deacetylase (PgdA/CDA1 family)